MDYKTVPCLRLMLIHFKQAEGSNFPEERKKKHKNKDPSIETETQTLPCTFSYCRRPLQREFPLLLGLFFPSFREDDLLRRGKKKIHDVKSFMLFPFHSPFSSLKHRSIIIHKGQVHEKHRGWKSKDFEKNFGLRKEQWLSIVILYYIIYFLTAIGLTPGGSSKVHIYTRTIHRTQRNRIPRKEHI